ncbi:MAG: type 1 glutamine amidotransferase [Candidatus Aminicenantaceae bacterium]
MNVDKKSAIKVAIIDNSINPEIYNPIEHWKQHLDAEWDSFRATKNQFPDLSKDYTHIILTGSEISILERENWVYEEIELIKQAVNQGLSILGSCYGHQMLALALAGPAYVRRCPQPEIGWIAVDIIEKNNILGNKKRGYSFSIHFDEVMNLPESFLVLASSKLCHIQAFQIRGRHIWGLQIHPEIDIPSAEKLLRSLINYDFRGKSLYQRALNSTPKDTKLIREIVKAFFYDFS